ncbi:MAG: hypothetical protein QOH08_1148 [Chloroflexota bacterium]|jgi:hypothetical protein|nr:hypothetical protein [Chloroflexota bacterium]
MNTPAERRPIRGPLTVALAVVVAAVLVVAIEPYAAEIGGRFQVQRAHDELRLPDGWSELDPPVTQVPHRGSVLLSAVYKRPGDPLANLRAFVEFETTRGWQPAGGAPDLSTTILRRDNLVLAAAVIQGAGVVRVELQRTVDTWW